LEVGAAGTVAGSTRIEKEIVMFMYHIVRPLASAGVTGVPECQPAICIGTERQRDAAERIRADYIRGANEKLAWWVGCTDDGETSARRAMGDLMPANEANAIARSIEAFVSGPGLDANMWLDHYKRQPRMAGREAVTTLHKNHLQYLAARKNTGITIG
jgi:hypothetical protein